jgi:hypothetical protein
MRIFFELCYLVTLTVIKIIYRLRLMNECVWSIGGVTQVPGEEHVLVLLSLPQTSHGLAWVRVRAGV